MKTPERSVSVIKPDVVRQGESLPDSPRSVVLFGSRISGAFAVQEGLTEYLAEKGIPAPVKVHRHVEAIRDAFDGAPPKGVILFPEMRVADEFAGATIPTEPHIEELVRELCTEHDVPLVKMHIDSDSGLSSEQQVLNAVRALASADNS